MTYGQTRSIGAAATIGAVDGLSAEGVVDESGFIGNEGEEPTTVPPYYGGPLAVLVVRAPELKLKGLGFNSCGA